MLSGLPVAFAFLAGVLLSALLLGMSPSFVTSLSYQFVDSWVLLAVPLFLLLGGLVDKGGLADRLLAFVTSLVGGVRGGYGIVIILTTMFLSAMCGTTMGSVAAIGPMLIPRLERIGWDRRYTTTLICVSGFLGPIIPPSVGLIILGYATEISVGALFIGSMIPGIITGGLLIAVNSWQAPRWVHKVEDVGGGEIESQTKARVVWADVRKTGFKAIPALVVPVIVLGGIYGGVFTPTEAGAVGAFYALLVAVFAYRVLRRSHLRPVLKEAAIMTAYIMIIAAFAMLFNRVMLTKGVPRFLAETILGLSQDPRMLFLLANVILLVLGMFVEPVPILLIMGPLMLPIFREVGVNEIHYGVTVNFAVTMGSITPPFALNLFMGQRVGQLPYQALIRPLLPLLFLACIPGLILTTYVPELSLWLPELLR
jgi:C4-dicarboxylate transporter DctM subunit